LQAQKAEQAVKSERRVGNKDSLRFVLLSEDGSRTTSGALESDDVQRAERQRRNGEPLLWFRDGDKEYVIRDPEVLREARALSTDVYRPAFETDAFHELTQSLESLNVDDLAQHGALVAQSLADRGILL